MSLVFATAWGAQPGESNTKRGSAARGSRDGRLHLQRRLRPGLSCALHSGLEKTIQSLYIFSWEAYGESHHSRGSSRSLVAEKAVLLQLQGPNADACSHSPFSSMFSSMGPTNLRIPIWGRCSVELPMHLQDKGRRSQAAARQSFADGAPGLPGSHQFFGQCPPGNRRVGRTLL